MEIFFTLLICFFRLYYFIFSLVTCMWIEFWLTFLPILCYVIQTCFFHCTVILFSLLRLGILAFVEQYKLLNFF